jgi:hypothetical protein
MPFAIYSFSRERERVIDTILNVIAVQTIHKKKEGGRQTKNIWLAHKKAEERTGRL